MALRIAVLLAPIVVIACSSESTVWPYADSAGEGGGTWLSTGFCTTSAIAANDKDAFVISCDDLLHTSAHVPASEHEFNTYEYLDQTGDVTAIAIDGDNLFVAATKDPPRGLPGHGRGVIYRRSNYTGSVATLASVDYPLALAIDASSVYWVEGAEDTATATTCSLVTTPKSGGLATTLATNLPSVVAIAAGTSQIYLATVDSILAVAKDGSSSPTTIASNQENPMAIAADGSTVYWTTEGKNISGPGGLFSATNGGAIQTLATDLYGATSVAVDATRVYFSSYLVQGQPEGDTVMSTPRDGGSVKILGWGQGAPMYLASTSSHLYWTDTEGDSLTSGTVKLAESE